MRAKERKGTPHARKSAHPIPCQCLASAATMPLSEKPKLRINSKKKKLHVVQYKMSRNLSACGVVPTGPEIPDSHTTCSMHVDCVAHRFCGKPLEGTKKNKCFFLVARCSRKFRAGGNGDSPVAANENYLTACPVAGFLFSTKSGRRR